jgi:gluconokinase
MTQRPITAFAQLGGLYFLPRTLDKIRQHARGALHPEHLEYLGKGFDGRLCHFLGVGYEALKARTLAGGTDDEILAWIVQQRGRPITEMDAMIWNGFATKRGWRDDATVNLERNKADSGLAHRADLLTFFDYYEVDEGRAPR